MTPTLGFPQIALTAGIRAFWRRLTPKQRLWVVLGGGGLLGIILIGRSRMTLGKVVQAGQEALFAQAIPSVARPYAGIILRVARELRLDPFILTALGYKETMWGNAPGYSPKGAGGTGDFARRAVGNQYAYPLPPDGGGWGRGLMQIDYGWHKAWLDTHDWRDPLVNVRKGGEILSQKMAFFMRQGAKPGDPRPLTGVRLIEAAIAAYNTGEGNVLKSLMAGKRPDSSTSGGDYATNVLMAASAAAQAFNKATA